MRFGKSSVVTKLWERAEQLLNSGIKDWSPKKVSISWYQQAALERVKMLNSMKKRQNLWGVVKSVSWKKHLKKASEGKTLLRYYRKNLILSCIYRGKSRETMLVDGKIQTHCGAKHCILSVQVKLSTFLLVWPVISHLNNTENQLCWTMVSSRPMNLSDVKGKISRWLLHRSPQMTK